ncbi:MAG: hypothetical protein JO208_04515 [Alphaproteobacteria bacterium]|nr:hypothetical protein [Alphaproteobacteria bacterium]
MAGTRSEHNGSGAAHSHAGSDGDEVQPGEAALQDESESERSGFIGRAQQKATGLAHTALEKSGEAISGVAEAVGQTASSLTERTSEMARRTGRAASNSANRAGSGMGNLVREQPLLVAGVGFALGVALGALLPLSKLENEALGEQAEKLKEGAKELASEGYERVKSVAQRTYDAATETLKSESGSSSSGGTNENSSSESTNSGGDKGGESGSTAYRH